MTMSEKKTIKWRGLRLRRRENRSEIKLGPRRQIHVGVWQDFDGSPFFARVTVFELGVSVSAKAKTPEDALDLAAERAFSAAKKVMRRLAENVEVLENVEEAR
jgi:hypothetical protein